MTLLDTLNRGPATHYPLKPSPHLDMLPLN